MSASAKKTYRPETRLVQAGTLRSPFGETSEALYLTQGYVYDSAAQAEARFKGEDPGYQYSRFANPTVDMFERRMAAFEGAEAARATATGMAAVTLSLVGQVKAGDHVVASKAMFGSRRYIVEDYLPRFGVSSTLVDGCNLDSWRQAVRPNTKTFFLESPTNPALEIIDIAEVAKIAHDAGATLAVDNVFATPLFQSPLALGADCVVYSATKHIDGQGRCLGGVVLGSRKFIMEKIHVLLRQTGPSMSPFIAWVLLKGLETLAVRVRRQTDSAATLAVALAEHQKIAGLITHRPLSRRNRCAAARRSWPSRSRAARRLRSASRTRSSSCASATISATPKASLLTRRRRRTSGLRPRNAPNSASATGSC